MSTLPESLSWNPVRPNQWRRAGEQWTRAAVVVKSHYCGSVLLDDASAASTRATAS